MPNADNDKVAPKQKKKSALPVIVSLLIILVVAAGVLHFTGMLKPLVERVRALITGTQAVPEAPPAVVQPAPEKVPVVEPVKEVIPEKTVVVKPAPVPAKTEDALHAAYRKQFRPPAIGSAIALPLKGGSQPTGILNYLDESCVKIKVGGALITLTRDRLAPAGLAKCYEDDYVKYMVVLHKQREEQARVVEETERKMADAYKKFMASKGKTVRPGTTKSVVKESLGSSDFKAWMEKNGATEMLKARQERIREYEAERGNAIQ